MQLGNTIFLRRYFDLFLHSITNKAMPIILYSC